MTDLQLLVKQTSNPSILQIQQRLHKEVVQLGKQALKWKEDYEALQLAFETERAAANLYAKQVAHWIEKHDALLAQQLQTVPQEWNDKNVLAWCVARGIKAAQEPGVKMVPIRQLFDHEGNQVCNLGLETCHFYVMPNTGGTVGAACNHCQRGIPNNKPHRLCPVLHESNK